jgi:tetratricopeptide (TPR) repeat protein
LSEVAIREGDYQQAVSLARSAYDVLVAAGARSWQAFALHQLGEAELALGHPEEARQAFERARTDALQDDDPMRHDIAAGLARVALHEGNAAEAKRAVRQVLDHLASGGTLEGTEDGRLIEWTLYRVLAAENDPRAVEWLTRAHDALQMQAERLIDGRMKHGFLNNIPLHRDICAAWVIRADSR